MSKYLLLPLLLLVALPFALAQDTSNDDKEVEAGITPDSALWGIDKALENINLALTFGNSKKAEKRLLHAQERLLEAKEMIEQNKLDDAEDAEESHKIIVNKIRVHINNLEENNLEDIANIENIIEKQEDELDNIRLNIKIKITGQLTDEQKEKLFAFLQSIEGNVDRLKLEIRNKEAGTLTKIEQRTGRTRSEIIDELGRLRETKTIKAKVFDDSSLVKVGHSYITRATEKEEIINEIIEKFAINEQQANRFLKIERGTEEDEEHEEAHDLEEDTDIETHAGEILRIKIETNERNHAGISRVRISLRFTNGIDKASIVSEIVEKTQLTPEQILEAIEMSHETNESEQDKKEIEVKVIEGFTEVEIKWNGEKLEFELKTTNRQDILNEISVRLGIPIKEFEQFIEFKTDDDNFNKNEIYGIRICHIPPDNINNPQTIRIARAALADHLKHGDKLGKCEGDDDQDLNDTEKLNDEDNKVNDTDESETDTDKEVNSGSGNDNNRIRNNSGSNNNESNNSL